MSTSTISVIACLMGLAASLMPGNAIAADKPDYVVEACDKPLHVRFYGLPLQPQVVRELEVCGALAEQSLYSHAAFGADPVWLDEQRPRAATLLIESSADGLVLRLMLPQGDQKLAYRARLIDTKGKRIAVQRLGHSAGPPLELSAEPLKQSLLNVHVKNASAQDLARDITRVAKLRVDHIDRVNPEERMGFQFDAVSAERVLELIADASNISLSPIKGGYEFGAAPVCSAVPACAKMQALQQQTWELDSDKDADKLRTILEKYLELATPDLAQDYREGVADAAAKLAQLATDERDYPRAEQWRRRQLAEIEREEGRDSLSRASAQAELGRILLMRQNVDAATNPMEAAWAEFKGLQPTALERDEETATTYLRLVSALTAERILSGDLAAAVRMNERALADRIAWLGQDHPFTHLAQYDQAMLLRIAHRDAEAREVEQQLSQSPPHTIESMYPEPNRMYHAFRQEIADLLTPVFEARMDAAMDRDDHATLDRVVEANTELTASRNKATGATLYEQLLKARLMRLGPAHAASQRAAKRAIELYGDDDPEGVQRINNLLAKPPR